MTDVMQNESVKSGKRGVMGVVLLLVLVGSLVCMVPVYMQNRINRLYGTFYGLREKASLLNREILLRDFEINKLSSMDHLAKFAEHAGLGLNGVPVKIMVTGESDE
jgi:cell division protein FtsL